MFHHMHLMDSYSGLNNEREDKIMVFIYRTKLYADGTNKQIETKVCDTKTIAEAKCLKAVGEDLENDKLKGSITVAVEDTGLIIYHKAWDRKDYPLDLVVEPIAEDVAEE